MSKKKGRKNLKIDESRRYSRLFEGKKRWKLRKRSCELRLVLITHNPYGRYSIKIFAIQLAPIVSPRFDYKILLELDIQ